MTTTASQNLTAAGYNAMAVAAAEFAASKGIGLVALHEGGYNPNTLPLLDHAVYAGAFLKTFLESYVIDDKLHVEATLDGKRVELDGLTDLVVILADVGGLVPLQADGDAFDLDLRGQTETAHQPGNGCLIGGLVAGAGGLRAVVRAGRARAGGRVAELLASRQLDLALRRHPALRARLARP